ncbi:hypothetical protein AB0J35_51525 [Nonomuraea angiospora]|uniref:hypothetical protein n=1 Tax=Nonomuraea angiospora TaxID=46172 RepID=UPI00343E8A76
MLGDRAAERFLLSDVLAQEHGFRTWAEFRAHLDSRNTAEERPVSRLMGIRLGAYASMADRLLAGLRRNDPAALQRLLAGLRAPARRRNLCRHRGASRARLIIARELRFPFTEKSRRDLDERQEKRRRLHHEAEALLDMLAGPETIPGVRLEKELGVPRAAVDVPLIWAVRSNRVEYVRLLLEAGADPGTRNWAVPRWRTPSSVATRRSLTSSPSTGSSRVALWTYAACGRLRRPVIRRRSWGRRSSMPASTAGSRSCAGSSTAASAPTSRHTSGGPACTGRFRPAIWR